MSGKITHIDGKGQAHMVDVGGKESTQRQATAAGSVQMKPSTMKLLISGQSKKGDVLATARIAGIMAAKKTPEIIPLCHPVQITSVSVELKPLRSRNRLDITATVKCSGQTGVEMEALSAVSASALTVYDMLKAVDKEMVISDIRLMEKTGGKSGHFKRGPQQEV